MPSRKSKKNRNQSSDGGAETEVEAELEPEQDGGAETEVEAELEPEQDGGAETEVEAELEPEQDGGAGTEVEAELEPEQDGGAGTEVEAELEPEQDGGAGTEVEAELEPEQDGGAGTEVEAELEPEQDGGAGTEVEAELEPEQDGGAEPESNVDDQNVGGSPPAVQDTKPKQDDNWLIASKISRNKIIVLDTNVIINYLFYKIPAGKGLQETYVRHKRSNKMDKKLLYTIDLVIEQGRFRLPKKAVEEFQALLHRDLDVSDKEAIGMPLAGKITMYNLIETELKQMNREKHKMIQPLLDSQDAPCKVGYEESNLTKVREMRKKLEGTNDLGKMKSGRIKKPEDVLDEGDMEILATAMSFSDKDAVPYLYTMDSDFIKHKEMILEDLGVEIVGEYED